MANPFASIFMGIVIGFVIGYAAFLKSRKREKFRAKKIILKQNIKVFDNGKEINMEKFVEGEQPAIPVPEIEEETVAPKKKIFRKKARKKAPKITVRKVRVRAKNKTWKK